MPFLLLAAAAAAAAAAALLTRPPPYVAPPGVAPSTPAAQDDAAAIYARAVGLQSAAAMRLGLPNAPTPAADANLRLLVATVLAPLQRAAGQITITSAYRSPEVNAAVGGVSKSDHMSGLAADIKVAGLTAAQLLAVAQRERLPIRQAIVYHPSKGGHLHVGVAVDGAPGVRQVLYQGPTGRAVPWKGQVS